MKKYKLLLCGAVLLVSCLFLFGCSNPDFYGENVSRATSGISEMCIRDRGIPLN